MAPGMDEGGVGCALASIAWTLSIPLAVRGGLDVELGEGRAGVLLLPPTDDSAKSTHCLSCGGVRLKLDCTALRELVIAVMACCIDAGAEGEGKGKEVGEVAVVEEPLSNDASNDS